MFVFQTHTDSSDRTWDVFRKGVKKGMEIPSRYVQSPKSKQVFHLILLNFGQYRTSKCIFFDIFQTQEMSKLSVISKIEFKQNSNYPFSGHLPNLTKRNYVIP